MRLPRTDKAIFRGTKGFERAQKFMAALGNPQDNLRIIHIAGTSGKGTTAMLTSAILKEAGFKVGLTVSPHVYDIRERCQINNWPITKTKFARYLKQMGSAIEKIQPTYFEVLIGLAFLTFAQEKVDYAVIETGFGGLLDATNTVTRADKICLLNRIGLDHTQILGKTLTAIARQKAGIIQSGNSVFALKQSSAINNVFARRAKLQKASLEWVKPSDIQLMIGKTQLSELNSQLYGNFQDDNAALAFAATKALASRDGWQLQGSAVKRAIKKLYLPGRFEALKLAGKIFILDGAHNQQKLSALLSATQQTYPHQVFGMIVAMGAKKSVPKLPGAKTVIVTSYGEDFQDMPNIGMSPTQLAHQLELANPSLKTTVEFKADEAIKRALASPLKLWLITGSFFILAEMKKVLISKGAK